MKTNSYVIYDNQAKKYNSPMLLANDAVAIRTIRNELINPNSQIALSPSDYSLYQNGEYDDETGLTVHDSDEVRKVIEVSEIELPEK